MAHGIRELRRALVDTAAEVADILDDVEALRRRIQLLARPRRVKLVARVRPARKRTVRALPPKS